MLASVAASTVFRSGPWRARVQPASKCVFQPLMACGCFCTAVPGSGLPAGVCLFGIVSVSVSRGPVACVALLLCFGVRTKGFGDPSAVCALDCSLFLSGCCSCLFWVSVSSFPQTRLLVRISPGHCCRPQALSSFPGTSCFGLGCASSQVSESLVVESS